MQNGGWLDDLAQYLEVPQRYTAYITIIGTSRQFFTCASHCVMVRGAEHFVNRERAVSAEKRPPSSDTYCHALCKGGVKRFDRLHVV
jgi:hypothetical protein